MIKAALKMISLFLALAAFFVVGAHSLCCGEELIWVVGKAVVTFLVCWMLIGWLAGLISFSAEDQQDGSGEYEKKAAGQAD